MPDNNLIDRITDPSSFGSVRCSASSISAKPQRRSPASNSCIGSGRHSSNSVDWAPRATRLPRFGMRFSLRDPTQLPGACLARPQNVCTTTVVGWSDPEGSRPHLGALLLGYYTDDGKLIYAGRVGTGMSVKALVDLRRRLDPLARKPLSAPPPRSTR